MPRSSYRPTTLRVVETWEIQCLNVGRVGTAYMHTAAVAAAAAAAAANAYTGTK